jgi:RNA polymerase sigma factor (sigma-70 family)
VAADPAVARAVADAHRAEWAFVLAATVRVTADLDLAEECVQAAFAKALVAWERSGIPKRPGAWLTTTARNEALDQLRRATVLRRRLPLLVDDDVAPPFVWGRAPEIEDDRLRLIFTCCHPALALSTQVALTLRLVCGLTTTEVARAFLVSESTMAARLTRGKKKISQARIPYRTPTRGELADRTTAVLQVVHLVFTTGHASPDGEVLIRDDLVEQALLLARMLRDLLPEDGGVAGLLALLVLTDARRAARMVGGRLVLLAEQDRADWDRKAIEEGSQLAREALASSPGSIFALMAAIASIHDNASSWDTTDFAAIVSHYDELMTAWPSPVVALNRAVAIGFAQGPAAGLRALEPLASEPLLASYPYFPAARADFCRQVGDDRSARLFYEEALMLTANEVERTHLEGQLARLGR